MYNGHKCWSYWNVALWIGTDEGLYHAALRCIRVTPNREAAASRLLSQLHDFEVTRTPDGAKYSKSSILEAMRGMT